ncbi:hypothetical protein Tco_0273037 [Tanacetum coccineum]
MTSPAFVEANYEVLESLLWERRRQISNEDLQTGLEYFNEDYDEERKMEPRPEPNREATPTLRLRSLVVRRQQERVVGFEESPNRVGSRGGRNAKEGKKDKGTAPAEAPILMIRPEESYMKNNALEGFTSEGREIMFPSRGSNSSAPLWVIVLHSFCGLDIEPCHRLCHLADLVS